MLSICTTKQNRVHCLLDILARCNSLLQCSQDQPWPPTSPEELEMRSLNSSISTSHFIFILKNNLQTLNHNLYEKQHSMYGAPGQRISSIHTPQNLLFHSIHTSPAKWNKIIIFWLWVVDLKNWREAARSLPVYTGPIPEAVGSRRHHYVEVGELS